MKRPPSGWLSHFVFEYLLMLPLGALAAFVWVTLSPESYYAMAFAAAFPVNDIAMVFFFGWMTKEIVEATAPGGLFHPWHRVYLPAAAAVGAVVASVVVFAVAFRALGAPLLGPGWPVLFSVDLALAYFSARVIFGRHPAVTFLLLVAIVANGLGFVALAVLYPARPLQPLYAAVLMSSALVWAGLLRTGRVRSFWPYMAVGGTLSWLALYFGGFHPAFALVPIIPFLPHAARDPGFFVDAPAHASDALDRFEMWSRGPAQFALFLFALINAGVPLGAVESGQWALPLAVVIGRPVGMLAVLGIARFFDIHIPGRLHWREFVVIGMASSIGFTLALFFSTEVFATGQLLNEMKAGALITVVGAPLAILAAYVLRVGRFAARRSY